MQLWSRTAREGEHVSALSHLRSPVADWERGVHVDWFCADQTYEQLLLLLCASAAEVVYTLGRGGS